jgi:hypothetical protein
MTEQLNLTETDIREVLTEWAARRRGQGVADVRLTVRETFDRFDSPTGHSVEATIILQPAAGPAEVLG